MKRTTLAIAMRGTFTTAACLQKDTTSTIYLRQDGSFDWVVLEQNVRSDERDDSARLAEEVGYLDAVAARRPAWSTACSRSAAEDVRMRWLASRRPYAVMVDARFDSLAGIFDRALAPCGVPYESGITETEGRHDVDVWADVGRTASPRSGRRRRVRREPRRPDRRAGTHNRPRVRSVHRPRPASPQGHRHGGPRRGRPSRNAVKTTGSVLSLSWTLRADAGRPLNVVPQHQLLGVGVEVDLARQVLHLVAPDVVLDERQRAR